MPVRSNDLAPSRTKIQVGDVIHAQDDITMSANFWWLKPPHQDKRCTGPARDRPDGRCHNLAHQDGLCKVHLRLAARSKRREETTSLDDVLARLQSLEFAERMSFLHEGREEFAFGSDELVQLLVRCIENGGSSVDAKIASFLDGLSRDLREGEDFEHTEIVMAVLHALKHGHSSLFARTATMLAASRAAEIGRLGRFAKSLLRGS